VVQKYFVIFLNGLQLTFGGSSEQARQKARRRCDRLLSKIGYLSRGNPG